MKNSIPIVWYSEVRGEDFKVNSPEWYDWLETVPSFSYQSADGKFTARKQGKYWNAYRKFGKLRQEYLAKTSELTLEKLQEVAKLIGLSDIHYWKIKADRKREKAEGYTNNSITTSNKPTSYINSSITTSLFLESPLEN